MPLYEYQCNACGIRFERRQLMSDEPIRVCPECGGEVHRLVQPVGIVFRGKGFYVTDNRAKSSTTTPASAKKPAETSSGENKTTGESSKDAD